MDEGRLFRLEEQERRGAIDRAMIRSRLDPKQKGGSGGGNVEFVAFTAHAGTGGDENGPGTFTYTFTDSDGVVHTNIAPIDQRPKLTLVPGTHGDWDKVNNVLRNVDEVPQTAVCATAPAQFSGAEAPAFGF